MVAGRVIYGCFVALQANTIVLRAQLPGVWVVAITANNTGPVHFALQESVIHVDLVKNLAIRVVQPLVKKTGLVCVQEVESNRYLE